MHLFRLEQVVSYVGEDVRVVLDGAVLVLATCKVLVQKVPEEQNYISDEWSTESGYHFTNNYHD